jgi:hypothetical protein
MEGVYIIIEREDGCESEDHVIGYTLTKESAIDMCKNLDNFHEITRGIYDDSSNAFKALEPIPLEPLIVMPKWASGLSATEITLEQREERDMIIKMNKEISTRNATRRNLRREQENKIVIDLIESRGYTGSLYDYVKKHVSVTGYVMPLVNYEYQFIEKID